MSVKTMESREKSRSLELKKHVAVIHSSNRLTLLQRKIANALLYNAYATLLTHDEHAINIGLLCQLIGYNSNDHKTIKRALINLLSTVLEWNLVDGNRLDTGGVWNASSIIADASIDGAVCTYSYSNKMRKLLYRPDIYAKIDMEIQARFHSSYGLALYENCNRFHAVGKTPWFVLEKFRKLMGIEGKKYAIFRDFKNRVIDIATREVNDCSPIIIEPMFKKENRRVVSIRFLVRHKTNTANHELHKFNGESNKDILHKFGFCGDEIPELISRYGETYIHEKILLVHGSQSYGSGRIRNPKQYLLTALEKDYRTGQQKGEPISGPVVNEYEDVSARRKKNELADAYHRALHAYIMETTNKLPAAVLTELEAEFSKYMFKEARGVYQDIYLKEGRKNPLVEYQFCLFVRQKKPAIYRGFTEIEKWIEKKLQTDTELA